MRLVACRHDGFLQAITPRPPLGVDLVAEKTTPYTVTFDLYNDDFATNLRGLWQAWSVYEEGEVVYLTPEGPESGDASLHTPTSFGAWRALQRTQHSEPNKPASTLFWAPVKRYELGGLNLLLAFPGEPSMNAAGAITGEGSVEVEIFASQTESAPSSLRYILQLRRGTEVLSNLARGQVIFRSAEAGPPGTESRGAPSAAYGESTYGEGIYG